MVILQEVGVVSERSLPSYLFMTHVMNPSETNVFCSSLTADAFMRNLNGRTMANCRKLAKSLQCRIAVLIWPENHPNRKHSVSSHDTQVQRQT